MADPTGLTPEAAFENLKAETVRAIGSYFPYDGKHRQVRVENLHVDDKLSVDDIHSQSEVKDKEATWGVPVKGDLKLIDKATGKVIDTKKGAVLARLPKLTNRYSYIVKGNEYQVDHLFRLKSGVYARVQDNGDLESEFNLKKSPTGRGFSVKLEAKNKKFQLKYGEAHIALYPILKTLGVSDDAIEASWGKELLAANRPKTVEKFQAELAKFYRKTSDDPSTDGKSLDELQKHVHDFFGQTQLRPDTTTLTLGKPYETVNGEALFAAAHKTLGISKGTHKPDDRDSLAFKEVAAVEDFIPEKIQKSARNIKAKLRQTIDSKQSVGDIISTDLFNRPIHDFFTKSGSVAERSDQTNPIQMLSAHRKTTLMSKDFGGIKSDNSLTNEMRSVNQSHLGFLDPMHTPESERTGITLHLAANVRKNKNDLEIPVFDVRAGAPVWIKVSDFHGAMAILPDQVKWVNGKPVPLRPEVKVKMPGGDIEVRPAKEARYVLPSAKGMFNYSSNLIPFLPANNGNRIMMADKQMEQAISLKHREAPLVQTKTDHPTDPDHTFEKFLGHFVATRAPVAGTVMGITKDKIDIKDKDGKKHIVQLYQHFPLNDEKGMMHSTPTVTVGDKVQRNQVLADNNYTKGGALAVGTNLRIGYLPYKGYNFEDGIVISQTAADKLTSEHLYKKNLELEPDRDVVSKEKFKAWAVTRSTQMDPKHFDALDENGVIKPGTRVSHGQVLIAAVGKNDLKKQSFLAAYGKKRAFQPFRDKSLIWDEEHEGVVRKVVRDPSGRGIKVYVSTEEPAVIGDKLSGRHGNKGIITKIVKDEDMPFTKDEKSGERRHVQVLLNPSGIPTRINPSQMLETAAAKIAEKTGKPYLVDNFAGPGADYRSQVEKGLREHGLTDEETLWDPKDIRKPLGSVMVGPQYMLKLKHTVDKKLTARGGGTDVQGKPLPDDIDKQPVKGGEKGGQGFGALEMYSLLGHNARHNIREMSTYKSDQQDMLFWNLIQTGHEPPPPKVPFAYNKFVGLLKGLGVNVNKEGTTVRIQPMNNKEVLQLAGGARGEIKNGAKTLRSKDLKPVPGGLFDPHVTGGLDGDKWSYLRLAEPVPNPIFCGQANKPGPVPVLLGLKMKELEEVMQGKRPIDGLTGGKAIEHALKKVNVEKEIEQLRRELPKLRGADLDRANRKLKYLLPLRELRLKPHEAYVMNYVPVVPPKFRPATPTPTGDVNYAPLNGHYKNLALINDQLKEFDPKTFDESHRQPLRQQLWDAMKALQSVGNYKPVYDVDTSGNRELKGILDIVGGDQPKEGYFQSKLVKRRQNLSIRSTIIPEPALGLDEVGIPRNAAMEMYKPYVVSQLHKWGLDPLRAQDEMKKNTALAHKALDKVVVDRPLLLKRDPALHKFSVMAFWPKLVDGKAIQIHPLVTGGYNADFDGDSIDLDTPIYLRIENRLTMKTGRELLKLLEAGDGNWVSEVKNMEAWTYNGWARIKTVSFHEVAEKKKYRVTLKNGVSFIVSEDHSLMVGRKEMKPTGLTVGTELDHTNVATGPDGSYQQGVLFGNFLGDGSAELRPPPQCGGRISIACKPEIERQYLRKTWEIMWQVHTTDSDHGYFQISNADLTRIFLKNCGRYCDGKFVGDYLLNGGAAFLKGLLAGYILSDGSVELTKSGSFLIRTWSRSKALRDGMSFAANMLGLPHSLRERVAKGETNYLISFGKEAIKLIDYRCPGKKGDLIKLARREYETNRNDDRRSLGERGFEVKSIEEVEYNDRMIDIEVDDESHVFTIHGGVVVHNTMAGTVPMSQEAVEEAKKLMPSNNLFSPTSYNVMYTPGHEALLGLHLLSKWGKDTGKKFTSVDALEKAVEKGDLQVHDVVHVAGFKQPTTLGRILIESRLPRGFAGGKDLLHDPKFEVTKKSMRKIVPEMAKKHTATFPKAIDALKDLGNEWSFKLGFSFGLKDLTTLPERDAILGKYQKQADHIEKTVKDPEERKKQLIAVWSKAIPEMEEAQKGLAKKGNRLATMVLSGARGDESQLRQMVAAPMLVEDSAGRTIPYPIKKSFSEGLDVGDFWMYQHGARKGILQKNRGTAEPGAITKDIINAAMSTLIVSPDCKTTHGVVLDLKDDDIHDRFLATPYKLKDGTTIPAGTLIDPEVLNRLKNSKHEKVLVRSPLKCAHGQGLCAKCFGLNEAGRPHDIGVNIGILASQALGEPSTQLSMKAFHTGGVAGTSEGKSIDAITRFRNLLEMPKQLKDEATVSTVTGTVTAVKKDAAGGQDVFVDGVRHYVQRHLIRDDVKPGMEVKKGETLSTGFVNPHKLLEATKDIHAVQNFLTNELHGGLFGGLGVRRRNVEVAVRSITNLAKIRDPGHSDWTHGDIVPRTVLDEHNRSLPKGKEPVLYDAVLKGTGEIPHLITQDWLQRLNYQQLHTTVQHAASQAQKSDIHSVNPIPALVHGAEFGRPPADKARHVY